jgi:RNA polymerase sigma factor (sigma-70 family)
VESVEQHRQVARWFEENHERLLRFLALSLDAEGEAEDLAQEVFLRMLRVDNAELVRHPRAYLYRVAANVANEWRMRGRRFVVLPPSDFEGLTAPEQPEEDPDGRDRSLQVNQALEALPPMYRAAIVLRTQEGMNYREVAERLGVTERMVKRYIVKGYARLRDSLAEGF